MTDKIPLIECINTWQGEGPDTGRQMLLTRFKRCNLSCSFCDTQVKMRNSIVGSYTLSDIQQALFDTKGGLLITGGEPTLYLETATMLEKLNYRVANVETNGMALNSLLNNEEIKNKNIKFIFSPKNQYYSFDNYSKETTANLKQFVYDKRVYFKFLIHSDMDIPKFDIFMKKIYNELDLDRVYLMPMGTTYEELKENSKTTFDLAEKYKCNISSRLHLIYNFL